MKKSFQFYVRSLHRDLGFLTIGLVIIFSLSGITLIYRDTDFLKREVVVEKVLPSNLSSSSLASALKLKNMKMISEDSATVVFADGSYSKISGLATYTSKEVIFPFNKFINLHKAVSKAALHWAVLLLGVVLLFLAISSFWMFKSSTKQFKRGLWFAITGVAVAITLLFLV